VYAVFVTGLSTAVAKPVADFAAKQKTACADKIRRTARILCLFMGLAGMLTALLCAKSFTLRTAGSAEAYPAVLLMTPAVLFCCLTAVERGYYEGMCSMTPTAVSQAAEAVVKLTAGLFFCHLFLNTQIPLLNQYTPESRGAAGAVLGVTLSTLAGWLYLILRNCFQKQNILSHEIPPSSGKILKLLFKIMIPAALGALVTNLTSLTDLFTMMNLFSRMLASSPETFYQKAGLARNIPPEEAAAFVYGSFMGLSVTVFNLVPSLTNMLARGVLPCTAQAWSAGDDRQASAYARQVLILTGLPAVPAGCGIFALSDGILAFLFSGRTAEIQTAVSGLRHLASGMVCLCLAFPVFSLLQAVGRQDLPVKIMLAGILVKILCNLLLIPHLCTAGAALSTSLCYFLILVLSLFSLKKTLGHPLFLGRMLGFQLWGGILCAGTARLCYDKLLFFFPQKITFLISVLTAVLIYLLVLLLTCRKELKEILMQKQIS